MDGIGNTVELPWAPENPVDLGEQFVRYISKNPHTALIRKTIQQSWHNKSRLSEGFNISLLEQLLKLLPNEDARLNLDLDLAYAFNGGLLLMEAASAGCEELVRLILQASPNARNQGNTYGLALYTAVSSKNTTIVKLLIEAGANVNYYDGKHACPLQTAAAAHGMDPTVQLLLDRGANPNGCGGEEGGPLMAAAAIDNLVTMRILLKAGADPNASAGRYGTALKLAVANGNPAAVFTLLDADADPNDSSLAGESPLRVAAGVQNEDIVIQLLKNGAHVDGNSLTSIEQYMKMYDTSYSIAQLLYRERQRGGG